MTKRTQWRKLRWSIVLVLCAAAAAARLWWPHPGAWAETWLLGPEGNQVTEAFAALEDGMGRGVGAAVAAFCEEFADDAYT